MSRASRLEAAYVVACALLVPACAPARSSALPPVTLVAPDGTATDARALAAGAALTAITFFSATCPVQAAHDARLVALADRYGVRGVRVVAVDSERGATTERAAAEAKRRGYAFPILVDRGGALADALDVDAATWTVVVDRDGTVRYAGGFDDERVHLTPNATPYVADALDDLLAGRAPRQPRGKPLGCTLQIH